MKNKHVKFLFSELLSNSGWRDKDPHWRGQNQLAHAAIGAFIAACIEKTVESQLTVLIFVILIGVFWEAFTLLRNGPNVSTFSKSLVDVLFYGLGGFVVISSTLIGSLSLTAITLLGAGVWGILADSE